jgi:2-polyprenyl-6-methoxyphenol hydroxylase-like FAD-dependent oxidoreductase
MDADVIVVGAGPVGLMLANELRLGGTRPLVVEALPAPTGQSRALNLHPRTAETLDMRGLLQPLLGHMPAHDEPVSSHFAVLPVSLDCRPLRTRQPYQVGVMQARVEASLAERYAEQDGTTLRAHRLVAVEQDADGVTATVTGPGERTRRLRARYLVGCDGGRSTVRKLLALDFPGTDGTELSVVADIVLARPPEDWFAEVDPAVRRNLRMSPGVSLGGMFPVGDGTERMIVSLITLEDGVHRLVMTSRNSDGITSGSPVSEQEVHESLRSIFGPAIEMKELRWASRFTDACRQVEQYRHGRILLAGDAAHIVYPIGGQGLNIGLQDAVNLGWKLAAQVRGRASDGLLDSYHSERHPVARGLLNAAMGQSVLMERTPRIGALRELLADVFRVPEANQYIAGLISGLGIRYAMPGAVDHPLVGGRIPDLDLRFAGGEARLFDLLRTGRGLLIDFADDARHAEVAARWSDRVDHLHATTTDGVDAAAAVLVRPDGYVCWASDPASAGPGLADALTRWFG